MTIFLIPRLSDFNLAEFSSPIEFSGAGGSCPSRLARGQIRGHDEFLRSVAICQTGFSL